MTESPIDATTADNDFSPGTSSGSCSVRSCERASDFSSLVLRLFIDLPDLTASAMQRASSWVQIVCPCMAFAHSSKRRRPPSWRRRSPESTIGEWRPRSPAVSGRKSAVARAARPRSRRRGRYQCRLGTPPPPPPPPRRAGWRCCPAVVSHRPCSRHTPAATRSQHPPRRRRRPSPRGPSLPCHRTPWRRRAPFSRYSPPHRPGGLAGSLGPGGSR
mmetsp:Transcript_21754/g.50664  ORF Transcript_21754/g.50664 Transcript_21754/m.50664 type:complete len:216 (-) Transcript_21754:1161-1808(-)